MKGVQAATAISATIDFLQKHQDNRLQSLAIATKLYGSQGLGMFPWGSPVSPFPSVNAPSPYMTNRITLNIIQSVIDTVTAKMAKSAPEPFFLTSNGDYRKRRKAKYLNGFSRGMFYEQRVHQKMNLAFKDAAVWGDGFIRVLEKDGRAAFERVLPHELWIDPVEAFYGKPWQIHLTKVMDRAAAIEAWPVDAEYILDAPQVRPDATAMSISDSIMVRESWRLPSGKGTGDGKHLITIEGATLYEEPWEYDFFPFGHIKWSEGMFGYYGTSLCSQLQSIQIEINRILQTIQEGFRLAGAYKVWVKTGSKIVPGQVNNTIGQIIQSLEKPEYLVIPNIVSPELYQHLAQLVQRAYEISGVSQLAASSIKPQGLDSKPALREYNDIQSDRFAVQQKAVEQLSLDLTRIGLAIAKGIYEKEGEYKVCADDSTFFREIDWSDIQLEEDEYTMQAFPVSSLPDSPEAKTQQIQEWVQAGWVSPRAGKRLAAMPDVEQEQTLSDSREEWVHYVLDSIVEDGEYIAPEPYDDLQLFRELTLQEYALGKAGELPEERLDLLRQLLAALDDFDQKAKEQAQQEAMMTAQAQAAAQPPGGQLGKPQAAPQPPPQSPLIPNVPNGAA